jgi:diguanylate cyclase (GGDEF)-like protein
LEGVTVISDVRVILVGKTGLDAVLRLDPDIELIRVDSPLEAIGELAVPREASRDHTDVPSVVVLPSSGLGGQIPQIIEGLRLVSPGVRVVQVSGKAHKGGAGAGAGATAGERGVDALISPEDPTEAVREAIRGPRPERSPATDPLDPPPTGNDTASATDPDPGATDVGDEVLVRTLVRGQDVLPAAIFLLRERLGLPHLEYVPGDVALPGSVAVAWEGRVLGCLQAGAASALITPSHAEWFAGWVRLRDQLAQLHDAAFTDPLTGAWNRRYFDKFLAASVAGARAARRPITVLYFDLDNFKQYNDQFGHAAGDEILREIVKLLRSVTRPTDRVCRIGGDEFAVIFHEPDGPRQPTSRHPATVSQIASRFQQQVREKYPKLSSEAPGPLSVSGGLATFPWDGSTPEELLARADELAMQSKRQGKNAILLGPEMGVDGPRPDAKSSARE